jgi:hypothetical protein
MNITDDDFDYKILRLDEGHDSDLGTTTQVTHGSKAGKETWVTSGNYNAEPLPAEWAQYGDLSLQIFHLEPEVEEVEQPSPFFD